MLILYLQAHFGVFRPFTTGSYRATAGFITHSAAYGLLLNIAGIDIRQNDHNYTMTIIKAGLPPVRLAIGALELPYKHSLYQQLHNYRIGQPDTEEEKTRIELAKERKSNVLPVRREFLSNIKAYLCLEGNHELEIWILEGLSGKRPREYGLPFLGDNNFLIDRLEPIPNLQPAYWFEGIDEDQAGMRDNITRLTITIDRADMAKTRSRLFAPTAEKLIDPPGKAWVEVNYS